jgi:hypothetical protein
MPSGTQDGRHYCVSQDAGKPGWPGMANNRVGFVHRFALVYLAQLGPCSGQVSTSRGNSPRRGPLKGAQASNLSSSEITEARALCAETHHTFSGLSICNDAEECQSGSRGQCGSDSTFEQIRHLSGDQENQEGHHRVRNTAQFDIPEWRKLDWINSKVYPHSQHILRREI